MSRRVKVKGPSIELKSKFPLDGFTQGQQEHHTFARRVGRKKFRDVVVEEGKPRGAEALGIGSKI